MNSGLHTITQAGISGYRPDVDGLRAIAIIAVVLYHGHAPGFGGGFVVHSARYVEPIPILCDVSECPPLRDGVVMFYDDNHLSFGGSRLLLPLFTPELYWAVSMRPNAPSQLDEPIVTN